MEPRDGVARDEVATLGPAHRAEDAHVPFGEPAADLFGAAIDIGFRPAVRPHITRVELAVTNPIAHREVDGVLDAALALLGRVDEEHPPERQQGEAAEALTRGGVQHEHPFAVIQQLERGDHPCETAANDDDLGFISAIASHGDRRG